MEGDGLCICGCEQVLTGKRKKYASAECAKLAGRAAWVMRVYGITLADYDIIFEFQGGRCGVCHREPKPKEVFHIDHEHGGHVRGLLCPYCNTRLVGRLKSHERAQQLADYLKNPPAVEALGRLVIAPGRPKKKRQPRKKERGTDGRRSNPSPKRSIS